MGQLNKIGRGLRPRSTMTLRFLQARLKHYIICWDRLNFCYSEEFTKLIGCCRFNWHRILSWHTKRSNIIDKVNSRGRYKKRVKMISSLCQNNTGGASGGKKLIEQKQSFAQLRGEQARGGGVFWQNDVRFLFFPLHAPDGKCAHEQNVDEHQAHITTQNVDEEIWGEMAVRLISLMQYIFADNSSLEMSLHPFLKPCLTQRRT